MDCPVYDRLKLKPGDKFDGPALVSEYASTTVIHPGDKRRRGEYRRTHHHRGTRLMTTKLDPVTLEVVRSALPAIATEMAADLHRTSYNMMIYEVRDFCTALLLPDARLVSQNVGGVSHFVADLGAIVEDGMNRYGVKGFKPDDVIITNHQAVAGQHLNNMVIYMPYFYKGELIMFSMVRAHWIDIGGMSTGFGAGAEVIDPWQEGLQLDQLKIYEEGKVNEVLLKVIRDNIRFPDSSLGDMRAQMAACKLAHRRLDELFDKFGKQIMIEAIEHIFKETEMKCRRTVATFPSGVYEAESFLDNDGVSKEPVRIHAKVTVDAEKGDMIIDLSGCSAARKAGINSRTLAGARVAYKSLTAPLDPVNEGSFNALKHVIPEGNIMMAQYPAPMAGWSTIIPTVVDTIIKALSQRRQGPSAGRASRHARRVGGVLRPQSQDGQGLRGAKHRGRRLGRAPYRRWGVCLCVRVPGRRPQRQHRSDRDEDAGRDRASRPAHRQWRRRQVPRWPRSRRTCAQPDRGPLEHARAGAYPESALGHLGRQAGPCQQIPAEAAG